MAAKQDIENLTNRVLESKKYRSLYKPTVRRIVEDLICRYPEKDVEKAVKRRLHQIWGAYFKRPDFDKLLSETKKAIENGVEIKTALLPILVLQTSTKERVAILKDFYDKIFSITAIPKTIVEPACGLNALTYFWMDPRIRYTGFDVDHEQIAFINNIFKLCGVQQKARVKLGDVLAGEFRDKADMVLLLKVLPLLEHQRKGCSLDILRNMQCKHIVVSFPTKSISGKQKGMVDFYTEQFCGMVKDEKWNVEKVLFDTELVFVVEK